MDVRLAGGFGGVTPWVGQRFAREVRRSFAGADALVGESRMSTSVGCVVAPMSFGSAAWIRRLSLFRTVARFATCLETTTAARLTMLCPGAATSWRSASRFRAPFRSKCMMSRSVWRRRLRGSMEAVALLDAHTLPALTASARQHGTSIRRGNASAKTMHTGMPSLLRLVRSLWHRGQVLEK